MITIIVLLILAGLTIALVSSENGLIAKAKSAASKYAKSAAQEELELALIQDQVQAQVNIKLFLQLKLLQFHH